MSEEDAVGHGTTMVDVKVMVVAGIVYTPVEGKDVYGAGLSLVAYTVTVE